jgi:hypothetical protein
MDVDEMAQAIADGIMSEAGGDLALAIKVVEGATCLGPVPGYLRDKDIPRFGATEYREDWS